MTGILATFESFATVKTRGSLKLVFEVPEAHSAAALKALGMPKIGEDLWCGIVRLTDEAARLAAEAMRSEGRSVAETAKSETQADLSRTDETQAAKPKRQWAELSAAEQTGIRRNEPAFWVWLHSRHDWYCDDDNPSEHAAEFIRRRCIVKSCADIDGNPAALAEWRKLEAQYTAWLGETGSLPEPPAGHPVNAPMPETYE